MISPETKHENSSKKIGENSEQNSGQHSGQTLSFLSLFFGEFLVFFPCEEFLVFLSVFPFFSTDFRSSAGIKNPCVFWWFSWPFSPKKQGKEGQGKFEKFGELSFCDFSDLMDLHKHSDTRAKLSKCLAGLGLGSENGGDFISFLLLFNFCFVREDKLGT